MPKQLSEAAAWRKLAEWCVGRWDFLCNATREWRSGTAAHSGRAPFPAPWDRMNDRIEAHAEVGVYDDEADNWPGWTTPFSGGKDDHSRVMFCLLMAHECEEEAKPRPKR